VPVTTKCETPVELLFLEENVLILLLLVNLFLEVVGGVLLLYSVIRGRGRDRFEPIVVLTAEGFSEKN